MYTYTLHSRAQDLRLKQLVSEYGEENFEKVAQEMPDRTWSQCSQRWQKVLNPEIVKGPWTAEVCTDC